jgi:hypothetical protein
MRVQKKPRTAWDRGQAQQSINVLVSGFAEQSSVSIAEVAATLNSLPAFHLVGLDQVIYDPKWETGSALALQETSCSRQSKAVFLKAERKILVFRFDDSEELRHILYHEIGHHVFERVLDSKQRKRWVTVLNPGSRHVTRYAARNAMEDFAESYATFMRNPKAVEKIYRKYAFLRDDVFAGIALNLEQGHVDISI